MPVAPMPEPKILLVYTPSSQSHLVARLQREMAQRGLPLDVYHLGNRTLNGRAIRLGWLYSLVRVLVCPLWCIPRLRGGARVLLAFFELASVSRGYELLDFHFFSREYIPFLYFTRRPYKLCIWGSDFLRESALFQRLKRPLYEKAVVVQVETPAIAAQVLAYAPRLEGKVHVANFGIDILDEMDALRGQTGCLVPPSRRAGRLVLACGYNGIAQQRHSLIFAALASLPPELQERIYLYVPLTYGLTPGYRAELVSTLEGLGIPYSLFEERLSPEDLARLRLETDIAVNVQTTDTLCASLIQHLYAGGVLLAGDWLPYSIFPDTGVYYRPVSLAGLAEALRETIADHEAYAQRCRGNRDRLATWASWAAASGQLHQIYQVFISSARPCERTK